MDKQMIEEMIKDMCEEYGKECNECPCSGTCANEQLAYDLIEKGYRKIPENAVVLTREEYEWLTCCFGKFEEIMNDIKKSTRKETAEKFAEKAKESGEIKAISLVSNGKLYSIYKAIVDKIDEIAKEIVEGKNG